MASPPDIHAGDSSEQRSADDLRAEAAHVPGATLETPVDFNRFGRKLQARVADWLEQQGK